ncbi:hypothetical protein [Clostridium sp.]|uniref:hypothetical protein n=1 Tax=Clostridium sp. TaxID=1506 RepID=UPI003D6D6A18
MKFRKNMFLEVSNEKILGIEFSKSIILNRVKSIVTTNTYYSDFQSIKDFEARIKNKNLYILVEGETVYIKMVTLPLVRKHLISDMIKNELRYYYKDIDHIAFTYKLVKQDKSNMDILVFCLKGNNLDVLKNSINNNITLKKVNLIQICFRNYYSSKISDKNYILVFYYNCNLYFLICVSGEIVANNSIFIKELSLFDYSDAINEFLEKYSGYAKLCKTVYYANVKGLNIDEFKNISLSNQILDDLKREQLLQYILVKG